MLIKTLVREGVQLALAVTLDCGAEALRWCEKGVGARQDSCSAASRSAVCIAQPQLGAQEARTAPAVFC